MPIALLGLKPNQNAYVETKGKNKGKWLARYVPATSAAIPSCSLSSRLKRQTRRANGCSPSWLI